MAELVDAIDSKSIVRKGVRVRVPLSAPERKATDKKVWAYIVGVALGDGNLSNTNGRAIRLRIACDTRYPRLIQEICSSLRCLLPNNKVSIVKIPSKERLVNISVYSNNLAFLMPWKVKAGPKFEQRARVPEWIKNNPVYTTACLRGLIQTDGSIYIDRGYKMINFTNETYELATDVLEMFHGMGYRPTFSSAKDKNRSKYTVRLARQSEVKSLIETIGLYKD